MKILYGIFLVKNIICIRQNEEIIQFKLGHTLVQHPHKQIKKTNNKTS